MFAATFVAVTDRLVAKATEPEVIVTPFTVMLLTDPAAPPVNVTVPVAAMAGVLSLMIEQFPEASIVKRSK